MKTITVKASQIKRAIKRAEAMTCDWQGALIEIALLPNVNRRWQELNKDRFPQLTLTAHGGIPFLVNDPEANRKRGEAKSWSEIAGYTLAYGCLRWNSVTDDGYMHSASCCWDGVRRETRSMFIDMLHTIYRLAQDGRTAAPYAFDVLRAAGVEYVNDLS